MFSCSQQEKGVDLAKKFTQIMHNQKLDSIDHFLHAEFVYVSNGEKVHNGSEFLKGSLLNANLLENEYFNYSYRQLDSEIIEVSYSFSNWTLECVGFFSKNTIYRYEFKGGKILSLESKSWVESDFDEKSIKMQDNYYAWLEQKGLYEEVFKGGSLNQVLFLKHMKTFCKDYTP